MVLKSLIKAFFCVKGVNIGERAREQATAWTNHNDDFVSLFYDGHNAFSSLLAGDRLACTTLINNMQEYIKGDRYKPKQ